jgi:hypothetical protein
MSCPRLPARARDFTAPKRLNRLEKRRIIRNFSGGLHRRGNGKIFEAANGFRQRPLNLVRAP